MVIYLLFLAGLSVSGWLVALAYLVRLTNRMRETREDMTLLHRGLDVMADECRRVNFSARRAMRERGVA